MNTNDGNVKRCPQCRGDLSRDKVVSVEIFLKVHAPDLYKELEHSADEAAGEVENAKRFLTSTKIDKMLEILHETKHTTNNQDKTIVFSQFTSMVRIIVAKEKKTLN